MGADIVVGSEDGEFEAACMDALVASELIS
jgi:hypothetical protein